MRLVALTLSAFWVAASGGAAASRVAEVVRTAAGLHRQGRFLEAEKAAAEALSLLEKIGAPDFDAAASLNDLATLSFAQGELERAERLLQRSREAYLALAGADDTRLASVLYNLAGVYVEQGRSAQAEPVYRRSLEIREKALGAAHPLVAEVGNNLGFLCLQQGNYTEAESRFREALRVWETFGASHAAYAAVAWNNLALLHKLRGGFAEAESHYNQALAVEEKAFGRDHPEVAATRISLAALYRNLGRSEMAMESYRQALAVLDKTVGAQDPLAIEARAQLAGFPGAAPSLGEYQILVVRTRKEAEDLRRKLEEGEKFDALSMKYSIDPHASSGGRFRARPSDLREELRAETNRLRLGEVSGVFPLGANWAIVKKISEPAAPPK